MQTDVTSPSREQRYASLRQHGDFTLAYSTAVQPGLRHFGDGRGYLAYETRWGYTFALGDPVAPPGQRAELVREFLSAARRPVFVQCSEETARTLHDAGLYVNEMGVDTSLVLAAYDFRGRTKEWLRYADHWTAGRGYRVEESAAAALPVEQLEDVSLRWRRTRSVKRREVRFLNRPFSLERQSLESEPDGAEDVRYFLLRDGEGRLVAFVMFDPLYRDGRVIGYCSSIKRRSPEAPSYGEAAIMKRAIERFQAEGRERLNLGLSPLADVGQGRFRANPVLRCAFRRGFRAWWLNRFFYPLVGHAAHKRRFRGEEFQTYYASTALLNYSRIIALMRLSRVF